jgi:hypothetical protein
MEYMNAFVKRIGVYLVFDAALFLSRDGDEQQK